jgi:hypothetical protein
VIRINDMTGAGWIALGAIGTGAHEFSFPTGLCVDDAGRVYVSDEVHRLIRFHDMSGAGWTTLGSMGSGPREFLFPSAIFVDGPGQQSP